MSPSFYLWGCSRLEQLTYNTHSYRTLEHPTEFYVVQDKNCLSTLPNPAVVAPPWQDPSNTPLEPHIFTTWYYPISQDKNMPHKWIKPFVYKSWDSKGQFESWVIYCVLDLLKLLLQSLGAKWSPILCWCIWTI